MENWIFSTEPASYPWSVVEREGTVLWDGIRGPLARKNLRAVRPGDRVWGYHGSPEKRVVCLARVHAEAEPDPQDPLWLAVRLRFERWLPKPVSRADLLATPALAGFPFLRIPRLSVSPVSKQETAVLKRMSGLSTPVKPPVLFGMCKGDRRSVARMMNELRAGRFRAL